MKINRFGINLDEGIPLNEESLDKFYVTCFEERIARIKEWIKDNSIESPLLFGGQIGAGKSTLITKIFSGKIRKPDVTLKFDKEGLNLDEGDFLSIVIVGFLKKALKQKIDLSFSKLPSEVFALNHDDWQGVFDILCPETFSMETFEKKITARKSVSKNSKYIISVLSKIGEVLLKKANSPLFILASGIDKFDTRSSAFFSMKGSIEFLSNFKTMFEVNAVHFFLPATTSPFSKDSDKEFIPSMADNVLSEILKKRMGVYAEPIKAELEIIIKWAGGNPRQAIRLLTNFQATRKNKKFNNAERVAKSIERTIEDLFAFASKPSIELVKVVQKDKGIKSTLLSLPGDKDTALESLYGNWILITKNSENGTWPAIINPLVKSFFLDEITITTEPEQNLLSQYAETYEISATGLGFDLLENDGKPKTSDQILFEFFASGVEEPISMKITEILDLISAALLSKDRKDRIIVGFKNKTILNAARAYLFAKANSYEYQQVEHFEILCGENEGLLSNYEKILNSVADIKSIEFSGKCTKSQLSTLDKSRDRLIEHQMLWWIPFDDLKNYLPNWIQLRELFEIFILEDELLGSLSLNDIKDDLTFFEDLVEKDQSSEATMVDNLKKVLEYLEQAKGGKNG